MKKQLVIAIGLMTLASTASAQVATCGGTDPGLVVNPTTIVFKSMEHSLVSIYTIGVVSEGTDPNGVGAPFVSQTLLPVASITAIAGEADCYKATLPIGVQATLQLLKRVQGSIKLVRTDGQESIWSGLSNPFVKAGPATAATGVRFFKL